MSSHVFSEIYRENRWAGKESLSGPGSGRAATSALARWLPALVAELGITSVLDVGCGDGYWMPDLPGYHGVDVAPEAVLRARGLHPGRSYEILDGRYLPLVAYDLVIVRDALQHLPLLEGRRVLEAIRRTGSRWLLASTYTGPSTRHAASQAGINVDIAPGEAFSPDLMAEPFSMGQPMRLVPDGWDYRTGKTIRDPSKHLGLWRLQDAIVSVEDLPVVGDGHLSASVEGGHELRARRDIEGSPLGQISDLASDRDPRDRHLRSRVSPSQFTDVPPRSPHGAGVYA